MNLKHAEQVAATQQGSSTQEGHGLKENNSKDTIQNIYIGLRSSLARAVMGIVPPREVEDIVQETYVRVCQVKHPENIRQPRSYLFRTARNLALDYLKRAETKYTDGMDEQDIDSLVDTKEGGDSTFDLVASNQEFALFCEAVRHLPVKCRRVFVLKKVYGYSQIEISKSLNISIGTVEKHISQGIKRCTYFMQQQDTDSLRGGGQTHQSTDIKSSTRSIS